jgi:hypothetical protein
MQTRGTERRAIFLLYEVQQMQSMNPQDSKRFDSLSVAPDTYVTHENVIVVVVIIIQEWKQYRYLWCHR